MKKAPVRYFELAEDMTVPGRWGLGTPTDPLGRELDDPWAFTDGRSLPDPGVLRVPVPTSGLSLDFSRAGFCIPVVHVRVATVFAELAPTDVQLFPVMIQGQADQFCILVATQLVRCIDDKASKFVAHWTPADGQPEKVGEYRNVRGLRIGTGKVGDARVFRSWGWNVALLVSEDIRDALVRLGTTGAKFKEV
ncbi:MAG: hypothetical protein EOO71_25835 [Myxococcaceae bacterium]|nr:MAG: hypothetical protein EOO71_25835 [Myxococcaceae bacterium]